MSHKELRGTDSWMLSAQKGSRIRAPESLWSYTQGYTNSMNQVARATRFRTMADNICRSLVRNLFHVTLLTTTILTWFLDFWKNLYTPALGH